MPKFVETEHLFLDLPAFTEALGKWLASKTGWRPNVLNFTRNLVDDMRPRPITRDLDWGVQIPLDGWSDQPLKKFYVWFDAVIGYFSASVEWARRTGDPDAWKAWWNDPDAELVYFMGKDNITFHAQIWPALLLGHNGQGDHGGEPGPYGPLNLPTEIASSEFLTMSGSKFSTSRGTVIYLHDFLREFGPDSLRYFIASAGPETQDVDFTWDEFVRRINFELANEWGNLVNRSISMAHKNNGAIPAPTTPAAADAELLALSRAAFDAVGGHLARSRFRAGISEAMKVVVRGQPVPLGPGAVEAEGRPGPPRRGAAHGAAGRPGRQHAAHAVPAALGADRCTRRSAAPACGRPSPSCRRSPTSTSPAGSTRSSPGTTRSEQARWASTPVEVGRPLQKPTPIFRKLDPGAGRDGPGVGPDREVTALPRAHEGRRPG